VAELEVAHQLVILHLLVVEKLKEHILMQVILEHFHETVELEAQEELAARTNLMV
jgi:hypothetical protein|tara:strand:- start:223 stop:387 length:165 start_codon:yes stop_codon:yes gene_type:complete